MRQSAEKRCQCRKICINYYPFGLEHKGYNNVVNGAENNFKTYLGQELNKELGLNWLSFRHRNYMPEIGRFFGVDPISEEFFSISTYQFAHNSPIWKIELEGLEGEISPAIPGSVDIPNHEPVKRTVTIVGQPTFTQDNRTLEQRAQDRKDTPRRNAEYRRNETLKELGPPANRMGHPEGSRFIMEGVAIGMSFYGGELAIGKLFQGATLLRAAITGSAKVDETIVVVGQGMSRVKDAQGALLQNGAKSVEVFEPSAGALKEWNTLLKGLNEGEQLSDKVVKGTKLFKENTTWIKNVNNSGKTILDIGGNGSGKASTFYEMEKNVIYGN